MDSNTEDTLSALIYYKENNIVVDLTKVPEQTEVKVYDTLGKLILNKTVHGNNIYYFPMMKSNQLFLVVAKSGSMIKKDKVLAH